MITNKKQSGFTIVELLIVIVVIGILASITVVAYTGIQGKARQTQMLSAVDAYEKSLRQYKILNGNYPISGTINVSTYRVCLGDMPSSPPVQAGYCWRIDWGGEETDSVPVSESVNEAIRTIVNPLPRVPSDHVISLSSDSLKYQMRGVSYMPSIDGQTADLYYGVKDSQECGRGVKAETTSDGVLMTFCQVQLD